MSIISWILIIVVTLIGWILIALLNNSIDADKAELKRNLEIQAQIKEHLEKKE